MVTIRYQINLLNESREGLFNLKNEALKDKKILSYLNDITNFHNAIIRNHKDPNLSRHKLLFLLDIGLETDIPEIESAVKQIMSRKDKYGVYQSKTNIPPHYGGKGEDVFGWCLCDAPFLLDISSSCSNDSFEKICFRLNKRVNN